MAYSADRLSIHSTGPKKYLHTWKPAGSHKATICLIHGLGEHGGRYHPLAEYLNESGYVVHAFDQQGHGQDQGERGCIESYDSMLTDIDNFLGWARKACGDTPLILLGHSMGGNLALNYALRHDVRADAVLSSSPMIRSMRAPGFLRETVARMLMTVHPNYRLTSVVRPERLMSDPVEQQLFHDDELFHSQLSLRLGAALIDSGKWAIQNAARLRIPLLLTHGTDDALTCPDASAQFANCAGSFCRYERLDGMLHDPFRDLDKHRVLECWTAFIDSTLSERDA